MEMLKLCVAARAEVCQMAVPILAEEQKSHKQDKQQTMNKKPQD